MHAEEREESKVSSVGGLRGALDDGTPLTECVCVCQGRRKDAGLQVEYGSWYKACKVDR